MATKTTILEVLGEGKDDLLLMPKVQRALQANERVKYLLTLLQLAQAQAQTPTPQPDDLSVERRRASIEDNELDQVIPGAALEDGDRLRIPGLRSVLQLALEETRILCEPLVVAKRRESGGLTDRLKAARGICEPFLKAPAGAKSRGAAVDPVVPMGFVGRLTSAERGGADSLHLVVMDAHKAINSLISDLSGQRESVGGADALGLSEDDRELVEAFMEGVNATRYLKGSHPGLATTAMRTGSKLMIQNDVGETDAHVVILEVETQDRGKDRDGDSGTPTYRLDLTYTDVHSKRIDFFAKLLDEVSLKWKKTESRYSAALTESAFTLCRGVLKGATRAEIQAALRHVGSSLVFLIDWNKARKRLRTFVRGDEAVQILLDAAKARVGHMSFLSYGDVELIYEALEALPQGTIRLGEPFTAILGRKGANTFLRDSLRLSFESYERKEPRALLLDRLRCLLLTKAQRRGVGADEMVLELAGLAVEASLTFRDALRAVTRLSRGLIARSHRRICRWEERADERLDRIRKLHIKEAQPLLPVGTCVDDALDALEDAVDLAHALETRIDVRELPTELLGPLEEASECSVQSAQLFFRIFHNYRELVRGGMSETLFNLINELKQAEQRGDSLKRDFRWKFLTAPGDPRVLRTLRDLSDKIETAINGFRRAGFQIHDLAYSAMERIHG